MGNCYRLAYGAIRKDEKRQELKYRDFVGYYGLKYGEDFSSVRDIISVFPPPVLLVRLGATDVLNLFSLKLYGMSKFSCRLVAGITG